MKKQHIFMLTLGIVFLCLILYFSLFQVNVGQSVVLYRFGKIVKIYTVPGLKAKFFFERIWRIYPESVTRLEIGFRTDLSKKDFSDKYAEPQLWELKHESIEKNTSESLVITQDENIVDVNCVVHYQISDLKMFITAIAEPQVLIQNIVESSIRNSIGKETLEHILVENKYNLQASIKKDIQRQLAQYQSGINILKINLQDIHPPVDVVHSFRDVTSAREDKNTEIYRALEHKETQIPLARAEAHQMIENARAKKDEAILKSSGDFNRFHLITPLYTKYKKHLLTKQYYDHLSTAYQAAKMFIISHDLFENFELFREQPNKTNIKKEEEEYTEEVLRQY